MKVPKPYAAPRIGMVQSNDFFLPGRSTLLGNSTDIGEIKSSVLPTRLNHPTTPGPIALMRSALTERCFRISAGDMDSGIMSQTASDTVVSMAAVA